MSFLKLILLDFRDYVLPFCLLSCPIKKYSVHAHLMEYLTPPPFCDSLNENGPQMLIYLIFVFCLVEFFEKDLKVWPWWRRLSHWEWILRFQMLTLSLVNSCCLMIIDQDLSSHLLVQCQACLPATMMVMDSNLLECQIKWAQIRWFQIESFFFCKLPWS